MLKIKVISLPYIFQVLYVLCFTRPRYQVSVYRTIGPLVLILARSCPFKCFVKEKGNKLYQTCMKYQMEGMLVLKARKEVLMEGLLFLWVLAMGYVILLWHSLSLPCNYSLVALFTLIYLCAERLVKTIIKNIFVFLLVQL